jgi:hypothetical protein
MKPNLTMHVTALSALAPESGNATELKAIADAIGAALNALADFGGKLDKMGPSAILAIFTVFFALLAFATAWVGRQ